MVLPSSHSSRNIVSCETLPRTKCLSRFCFQFGLSLQGMYVPAAQYLRTHLQLGRRFMSRSILSIMEPWRPVSTLLAELVTSSERLMTKPTYSICNVISSCPALRWDLVMNTEPGCSSALQFSLFMCFGCPRRKDSKGKIGSMQKRSGGHSGVISY